MGNSSTKEQRPSAPHLQAPPGPFRRHGAGPPSPTSGASPPLRPSDRTASPSRHGRRSGSRPELSFLGLGGGMDSDTAGLEVRRETKQEREARRAERERVAREKERVRSMRDESVDGGYLVTQGVYTGTEDFSKSTVRQLMIERRIAPFWRGLNEHSSSWKDHQLVCAARGQPIPLADPSPTGGPLSPLPTVTPDITGLNETSPGLNIPVAARSHAHPSDGLSTSSPSRVPFSQPAPTSPLGLSAPPSSPFRPRSKTAATLTSLSKNHAPGDMTPYEVPLPPGPLVEGRPIEVVLYKDAAECPICFLYYPPHLNRTRCCDQPICSECFVQIKRPDPHPPEHIDPTSPSSGADQERGAAPDGTLVSEPAGCPFCVQPEFGITYEPPTFRRGLTYGSPPHAQPLSRTASGLSESSSRSSASGNAVGTGGTSSLGAPARRRTTSLSVNDASVVTTDKIRPDWMQKLASAKAQAARRAAAATALHTAAYLMGNGNGSESRGFGTFGRRHRSMPRSTSGDGSHGTGVPVNATNMSALVSLADRQSGLPRRGESQGERAPAESSSRRARMDDLEEMMMMEAIRLSLASEEERKKKEDKDAKKEAKKKAKEQKREEKVTKRGPAEEGFPDVAVRSSAPMSPLMRADDVLAGKGKSVDRASPAPPLSLGAGSVLSGSVPALLPPEPLASQLHPRDALHHASQAGSEVRRPSHLRQVSNTSSTASSIIDHFPPSSKHDLSGSNSSFDVSPNASGVNVAHGVDTGTPSPPAGGTPVESLFNFQSLAAMIGKDQPWIETEQVDHTPDEPRPEPTATAAPSDVPPSSTTSHGGNAQATAQAVKTEPL
ncbi:MAG: SNF1-interacting protein [Thelocarpon superellum]|nr:MAG: SNF1-interacting protein [Thelocarpon superellum]